MDSHFHILEHSVGDAGPGAPAKDAVHVAELLFCLQHNLYVKEVVLSDLGEMLREILTCIQYQFCVFGWRGCDDHVQLVVNLGRGDGDGDT